MLFDFGSAFAAFTKASDEATTPASVSALPIPEIESPRTTTTTALPEPGPGKSDGPLVTKYAIRIPSTATIDTMTACRLRMGFIVFLSGCHPRLIAVAPPQKHYQLQFWNS